MLLRAPRISNPNAYVEMEHNDLGDILVKGVFVSQFEFDGKVLKNYCELDKFKYCGNFVSVRYVSDCGFLAAYDIDLTSYQENFNNKS